MRVIDAAVILIDRVRAEDHGVVREYRGATDCGRGAHHSATHAGNGIRKGRAKGMPDHEETIHVDAVVHAELFHDRIEECEFVFPRRIRNEKIFRLSLEAEVLPDLLRAICTPVECDDQRCIRAPLIVAEGIYSGTMSHRAWHWVLLFLFIGLFLWGLNARYPLIGEDYFYVFPRLLEGKWHFVRQGLAPLRFAPHLCGGFPQYGNPQDHFYSLPQMLSLFLDLWTALQLSLVVIILAGFAGWVRFGKDILRLSQAWSHLLALVCMANGFYFLHMVVGHLWVISLPLLSWILWLLLLPGRETGKTLWVRAIAFGLLSAYFLYSGSQTLVFLILLSALSIVPLDLLLAQHTLSRFYILLRRFVAYGFFTLALSASKIVAVGSLLQTLKVAATFSGYHAAENIVAFALKSFWALPQSVYLFPSTVTFSRVQEESMYTPHIALLGILALLFFWVRERSLPLRRKLGLALYAVLLITFILLLVRGTGAVPETLQHFPLFSALRVPERFLFILSLLVSLSGVWGAAALTHALPWHWDERVVTFSIGIVTILGFALAYVPLLRNDPMSISLPYDELLQFEKEHEGYLQLPVTHAFEPSGEQVSDFHYLYLASTGTQCYEALPLQRLKLRNGPVDMVYDGAFNIYNPACLQYPEENHCHPGDRIGATDRQNLLLFTHGEKTTWKLSHLQIWADRLTVLSLVLLPLSLIWLSRLTLRSLLLRTPPKSS